MVHLILFTEYFNLMKVDSRLPHVWMDIDFLISLQLRAYERIDRLVKKAKKLNKEKIVMNERFNFATEHSIEDAEKTLRNIEEQLGMERIKKYYQHLKQINKRNK